MAHAGVALHHNKYFQDGMAPVDFIEVGDHLTIVIALDQIGLQLGDGFAQGVESILAELQFLGQLIATLALAVARILLGFDLLCLAQQRCDLG